MPRLEVMQNFEYANLGLITNRTIKTDNIDHTFVTSIPNDLHILETANASAYTLPLYTNNNADKYLIDNKYRDQEALFNNHDRSFNPKGKKPNLNQKFLDFIDRKLISSDPAKRKINPEEIFYYIYAVLYSITYREKYREFLKEDFPRIPITENYDLFKKLAEVGERLVSLHLMKFPELNQPVAKFYGKDSNLVDKQEYLPMDKAVAYWIETERPPKEFEKTGIVKINDTQFFAGVKPEVWDYYIGGYQVLDKWLKDRKGRTLSADDIKHYCRIVTILEKTIEIQNEIDKFYLKIEN